MTDKLTNLMIRSVPSNVLANIQTEAASRQQSQQEFLLEFLTQQFGDQPTVVLWIPGRPGEQDDRTCQECGQDLINPHVGLMSNGTFTAVICGTTVDPPMRFEFSHIEWL